MVALFMIVMLLVFLGIDFLVQRNKQRATVASPAPALAPVHERFLVPRGYFFSPNHSWLELLSTGNVRLGIDDFSQKVIGTIEGIEVRPVQSTIRKGEPLLAIRQGNRTLSITSPVTGRIVEVNQEVRKAPSLLNNDPYVNGWVAVVEPENISIELKALSVADETAKWLKREISRFRDFIREHTPQSAYAQAGITMADGGVPMSGVLKSSDEHTWKAFEKDFLSAN
jgi:glycine cleavage system H protein